MEMTFLSWQQAQQGHEPSEAIVCAITWVAILMRICKGKWLANLEGASGLYLTLA